MYIYIRMCIYIIKYIYMLVVVSFACNISQRCKLTLSSFATSPLPRLPPFQAVELPLKALSSKLKRACGQYWSCLSSISADLYIYII